jgi:hypothetical protein
MGDKHHRSSALEHSGDDVFDEFYGARIQSRMRLIKQQEFGLEHYLSSEFDPALHTVRRLAGEPVACLTKTYDLQRVSGGRDRGTGNPGGEFKVGGQTQFWIESRAVSDQPDPRPDPKPIRGSEVSAEDLRIATSGPQQRRDDPQQGCLAGAIRSKQTKRLTGANREIDVSEDGRYPNSGGNPPEHNMGTWRRHSAAVYVF